jgi:hypothetical protein
MVTISSDPIFTRPVNADRIKRSVPSMLPSGPKIVIAGNPHLHGKVFAEQLLPAYSLSGFAGYALSRTSPEHADRIRN